MINIRCPAAVIASLLLAVAAVPADPPLADYGPGEPPANAQLVFTEDWSSGKIDRTKWYIPRKKWGDGNHGVVPENVRIAPDTIDGRRRNVLVCTAHGDHYDGPVVGIWGQKSRAGGIIVSKPFFASGRFEVVMKIGSQEPHDGGPDHAPHPRGAVPAIWTYAYRWVQGDADRQDSFVAERPLYNPHMPAYGGAANEYWSELDFPEFGKDGDFNGALYNTFCQNRHDSRVFDRFVTLHE